MIAALHLLAQRGADSPVNTWLSENPMVLGLICLALGGAIAGYGAYELKTGVTRDKRGRQVDGNMGSYIRLGFGALVILFGLFKMVAG